MKMQGFHLICRICNLIRIITTPNVILTIIIATTKATIVSPIKTTLTTTMNKVSTKVPIIKTNKRKSSTNSKNSINKIKMKISSTSKSQTQKAFFSNNITILTLLMIVVFKNLVLTILLIIIKIQKIIRAIIKTGTTTKLTQISIQKIELKITILFNIMINQP